MKDIVKHVQNISARYNLWNSGDVIIVGVSGGPDSMCLLDVMRSVARKKSLLLVVAHVNYGLRAKDAQKDQQLVEKYAQKFNIPCEVLVCHKQDVVGSENRWRHIRYAFFAHVAKKHTATCTVVGHTKNDQAETLLLHLLRGCGLQGLSAMQVFSEKKNIARPLLFTMREDILSYCKENAVPYNIDQTNDDERFMRNKVRNKLIPYLQKHFNPHIVDVLARTTFLLADDYAYLLKSTVPFWQEKKNEIVFSAHTFLCLDRAQQRRALRIIIVQLQGNITDIDSGFVEELRKVIASTKNKQKIVYTKHLKMHKKGDTVKFVYH